ncbi:NAD(P)H-dependent oxidoreductase [Bacteriovorax sp. PP10]|uniref:NAD(P)H-dependent oxidoreductase n=1 Tax=Bacteriovorax antarcticus TaxID=3088717 RepID=A0ABU5VWP9_9BACT|nr:NAD(P)H-dependent oxidoreductase [Bacteriovorax sp. PP10]MEA9357483.1 NAD(P)H-dependent oxidoreductase [Bacteriovorax sp. PP10]
MKKICVITASVGKNLELAEAIVAHLKKHGADAGLLNLVELDLPLYSTVAETRHQAEVLVAPFKDRLAADAFVFVSPEYNGSTPPVFNNFLAWVSRSTKNWRETFNAKTGVVATASAGNGIQAINIMRMQLSFIGMNIMGRQLISTMSRPAPEAEVEGICLQLLSTIPNKAL